MRFWVDKEQEKKPDDEKRHNVPFQSENGIVRALHCLFKHFGRRGVRAR